MQLAIVNNGTVERIGDYKELFPSTSFGANGPNESFLQENNCLTVTVFKPYDSKTQKLVPVSPYVENNQVFTVAVQEKTQEEITAAADSEAAQVRSRRNALLASCDWTQIPDSTADKQAWATYRTALRDISSQVGFPYNVEWPLNPDEQAKEIANGN